MRHRLLLAVLPIAPISVAVGACGQGAPAAIGLVMKAPLGLLDDADTVTLTVFDASQATCGADGHVKNEPTGEGVQSFELQRAGCVGGAKWCKDIELEQDGSTKMFAVKASDPTGILGEGCATATIDQDPLEVQITVQRRVEPRCCNDGVLQVGEQCDLGVVAATDCSGNPSGQCVAIVPDDVCECDCLAKEIPIDRVPGTGVAAVASKSQLSMAFAPTDGLGDALRLAFADRAAGASGGGDVQIRILSKELHAVVDPTPLTQPLRIPILCSNTTGSGAARVQDSPAIAPIAGSAALTAVVFASDQQTGGQIDVQLSAQSSVGCSDLPQTIKLNTTAEDCASPDVAGGPPGAALAVWTRNGRVVGRIWRTTSSTDTGDLVPAASELDFGPGSTGRVAGNDAGWVVVYSGGGNGDSDGIFKRTVDPGGSIGPEVKVNAVTDGVQDQADVALLGARALVAWRSGGDVFFQRYDEAGAEIVGDQGAAIHRLTDGEQGSPAVAAANGFGDFFAVAWEDRPRGAINARFVGGSAGFGFNSVTGQNDDFDATHAGIHPGVADLRRAPAVAIGGSGFVAIGWEDHAPDHAGVYVRRFPLPE